MSEEERQDQESEKLPKSPPEKPKEQPEGVTRIKYDHFAKMELRTAEILEAERVEGTDKLLRIQLAVGEEKRQIVAGIAEHYEANALVGKMIVIVANLKPAKIRGVKSNGMLLAASAGETLRLVTVDGGIPSGAKIS